MSQMQGNRVFGVCHLFGIYILSSEELSMPTPSRRARDGQCRLRAGILEENWNRDAMYGPIGYLDIQCIICYFCSECDCLGRQNQGCQEKSMDELCEAKKKKKEANIENNFKCVTSTLFMPSPTIPQMKPVEMKCQVRCEGKGAWGHRPM